MSFSLNEVEALSKRAARGAHFDWGMAEEAAKATRWLCANGFDGCRSLGATLEAHKAGAFAPRSCEGEWGAETGALCPILSGAALTDRAHEIANAGAFFGETRSPLMLLPFVAWAARSTQSCLSLDWKEAGFATDGRSVSFATENKTSPYTKSASKVTIARTELRADRAVLATRARPDPEVWEQLNSLAARTYAPATELSRRLGAGAEKTDND